MTNVFPILLLDNIAIKRKHRREHTYILSHPSVTKRKNRFDITLMESCFALRLLSFQIKLPLQNYLIRCIY